MAMIPVEGAPKISTERIEVAAFDIDGVLVDAQVAEMSHALAAIGVGMRTSPERSQELRELSMLGKLAGRIAAAKESSHGNPQLEYDAMVYEGFWEETFAEMHPLIVKMFSQMQLNPKGAIALVEDLCATDIKTAAWTSRSLNILSPALCPHVIREPGVGPRTHGWFDVLVSADDVGADELKPHPRGGAIILETLGVQDPQDVVYFGDRPSDMVAARALGMIACGIADLQRGTEAPRTRSLIDAGACYLADTVADARGFLGLPEQPATESEVRERNFIQSRQYYQPSVEEMRRFTSIMSASGLYEQG